MKSFQWSWLLGILSYAILGVLRRSGAPVGETSSGTPGLFLFLLSLLFIGMGLVFGVMSLKRREGSRLPAIGAILLNIAMGLTGIILISPE